MAGDWLKWTKGLPRKSEILMMASILNMESPALAGYVMTFFEWVDDNAKIDEKTCDAVVTLDRITLVTLDRITGVTGLCAAMIEVGWAVHENGVFKLVNFGRHNGQTAKQRALTKKRMQRHRSVTEASPEKRREEKSINTVQREQSDRIIPSWPAVQVFAKTSGVLEWKARDWFEEMDGCGWKDHAGRDIQNWQSVFGRMKSKWEADGRPSGPPSNQTKKQYGSNDRSGFKGSAPTGEKIREV